MKISNFKKWNEKMVKKYNIDEYYDNSNSLVKYIENKRINFIIKTLKPKEKDNILEIGCGAGHIIKRINKGNITGLDFSKYALDLAKKRFSNKKNIILVEGDAQNLNFKNKFDKIICTEVLEHIPKPNLAINEICRIAKKESTIIITIPNERLINHIKNILIKLKLFKLLFKNTHEKMNEEWHLHMFTEKSFKKLLKNKLKIIKIKRIPFYFFPVRYIFECRLI